MSEHAGKKLYAVTVEYTAIVMAESEIDAYGVAHSDMWDITRDNEPDVTVGNEVKSVDELSLYGWDDDCLPYGGDGSTRLKDIFEERERNPEPVRCDKTVDMFEEKKA